MVNVLLESYKIDEPYLYDELKRYIKAEHRVAIVAFSFRDSQVKSLEDWNDFYSPEYGLYYESIVGALLSYGILEENISFINYYADTKETAAEKVKKADVVYFLGGLPDKMMERIKEFELYGILLEHKGVIMGYSAGALIQLSEYHLSPDKDYPNFVYCEGLPYLNDFYLEVHYAGEQVQNESIARVLRERNKTVYATLLHSGTVLVDNGRIKLLGDVKAFEK